MVSEKEDGDGKKWRGGVRNGEMEMGNGMDPEKKGEQAWRMRWDEMRWQ